MELLEQIEAILREAKTGADGPMPHSSVRPEDFYTGACEDIARAVRAERTARTARAQMLTQRTDGETR